MYRKIFNTTFALIAVIFSCVLVWINVKIQLRVDLANKEETHKEVILTLNYIEKELKEHQLGEELQELYPEGFVFINVLYGLTWLK